MRTTVVIDDDVLDRVKATAARLGTPFRTVLNEALRAGLSAVETPPEHRPYRTKPRSMGLRAGRSLDNIQELMAQVEGEDSR